MHMLIMNYADSTENFNSLIFQKSHLFHKVHNFQQCLLTEDNLVFLINKYVLKFIKFVNNYISENNVQLHIKF